MPHTDGPLYFPFVNALSMISPCIFKFYKNYNDYKELKESAAILCEPCCLTCFTEAAYDDYLHCILDLDIEYVYLHL